ncbi:SDR family NAD(P)-dependent oxidoreductase, partial [Enterobacter kobei]|uniref:SDR family NAD(P)-dependent oxidoreductase n=1 Tax=Enterobacter kobei TaxID=208224 RepID=UPI0039831DF9
MDLQLNGKTALVTGATAGIGLAIASTLAREGVAVTITGRDREKLHNAVAKIAQAAPQARVSAIVADLANAEGAEALIKACTDTDILINNLGFYGTVAKLAMRQPFVLFKGLTFQKLCLPGAFRPGDHHN